MTREEYEQQKAAEECDRAAEIAEANWEQYLDSTIEW